MSDRPLPSSFDDEELSNETGFQQVLRKLKKEPLVPLGALLTAAAVIGASRAMRKGDHVQVQRMFRARVAAQSFTVLAMCFGGIYYSADRHRERERWKAQRQEEEEEKRQKWIRELEIRDEEDRALQERVERRRKRAAERSVAGSEGSDHGTGAMTSGSVVEAVMAAQARTGTKVSKAAERVSSERPAKIVGQVQADDDSVGVEKKEAGGAGFVGSSLGSWFGGSSASTKPATTATQDRNPGSDPQGQKKAEADAVGK